MDDDDPAEDTPLARLRAQRLACDLGIAATERCLAEEWLRPFEAGYRNRQAWWLTCREAA